MHNSDYRQQTNWGKNISSLVKVIITGSWQRWLQSDNFSDLTCRYCDGCSLSWLLVELLSFCAVDGWWIYSRICTRNITQHNSGKTVGRLQMYTLTVSHRQLKLDSKIIRFRYNNSNCLLYKQDIGNWTVFHCVYPIILDPSWPWTFDPKTWSIHPCLTMYQLWWKFVQYFSI